MARLTPHDNLDAPPDPRALDPRTWMELGMSPAEASAAASPFRWERDLWAGQHVVLTTEVGDLRGILRAPLRLHDDNGFYGTEVAIYPPAAPSEGPQRNWNDVVTRVLRAMDYARLTHEHGRWHIDHARHAGTILEANAFPVLKLRFAPFPGIVRPHG